MKRVFTVLFTFMLMVPLVAQNVWINEIHYDNASDDVGEMVEVVLENPGNYNLADFTITFYNGSNGTEYGSAALDQFTEGSSSGSFTIYHILFSGIQNGAPDGLCLDYQDTVIPGQFLSYEGSFAATDGVAIGLTSTDIGVSETGSTPVGQSLQLLGSGTQYSDFTWSGPHTATNGTENSDGAGSDQTLPVELTSFTASGTDGRVTLSWSTASEVDNQGFEIVRSVEKAGDYKTIDSYISNQALKGAGTSSESHSYKFVDNAVFNNITYWYKLVDVDMNGLRTEHGPVYAMPHVNDAGLNPVQGDLPKAFALHQNFPNPFNPNTTIRFDVPDLREGMINVKLTVYDLMGKKVKTLLNGEVAPGPYKLDWNATNSTGNKVPSGVYVYQLVSDKFTSTHKMVVMK